MPTNLRRHPFAAEASFRRCLVLTYAVPAPALAPLVGPGLVLDTYGDLGFLAVTLVETEGLRPKGLPAWLGQRFFLSGYRIFCRFARPGRAELRGLKILRSDTDRRVMQWLGNAFTHYGYRYARVERELSPDGGTYSRARDLLLSPRWMVAANTALLGATTFVAFGGR